MDEVTREMRQYQDTAEPGEELTDAQLDDLIDEAIGDAIWRAAYEDVCVIEDDGETPPW